MRQNAFGGRAPPGPAGELEHSPDTLAAIVGCLLPRGREGKGRGKGKEGDGKEGEGDGREVRRGEGGKGRDDLHPTLFLGLNLTASFHLMFQLECCFISVSEKNNKLAAHMLRYISLSVKNDRSCFKTV